MKTKLQKAAAILGSVKNEKKAAAARKNGLRRKRKRKRKASVEYFENDPAWRPKVVGVGNSKTK